MSPLLLLLALHLIDASAIRPLTPFLLPPEVVAGPGGGNAESHNLTRSVRSGPAGRQLDGDYYIIQQEERPFGNSSPHARNESEVVETTTVKIVRLDEGTPPGTFSEHHNANHHPHHGKHPDESSQGGNSSSQDSPGFKIEIPEQPKVFNSTTFIIGLRIETVDKGVNYEQNGVSAILADSIVPIRLFGQHFTNQTMVMFVNDVKSRGAECEDTEASVPYVVSHIGPNGASATIEVSLKIAQSEEFFFLCVKENDTDMPWVHQGSDPWITIKVYERLLPLWLNIVVILLLLMLSGLFAGLTLGLMALDRTDLKILANTGSEKERMYAKTILPLRTQGNYLLCSLVLGNVLINSSLTILLDNLTSGILAVTFSTMGIVIFGEIIPQAFCSRHGLAIGAKTILITRLIMILTFPLSYVISLILDKLLGEEIGIVYNREKLKELVKITIEHNDLEADEVNIISGALELKKKTVEDIMTRLEDIFMLPLEGELDFETLNEIRKQGYSRIPIYDGGHKKNIVTILFTKDLVFVDPDDKIPLKTLAQFYNNACFYVFSDTTLDVVFREFKESQRGHMAFVQKIQASNDRDPFCETVGLVTLEDVIEELIQAEIVDETDVYTDNRSKKKAKHNHTKDFSKFVEIRNCQKTIYISPQLALATFQFLSTSVDPFKSAYVSEGVLHKILTKNVLFKIRGTKDLKPCFLYEMDKQTDAFTLILEGRVEVKVGKEGLQYEAGPFGYFAVPALMLSGENESGNFVPDYTVKTTGDVILLRIRRPLYQAAVQATILERAKKDTGSSEAHHDQCIEKQIEDVLGRLGIENAMETPEKILAEVDSSSSSGDSSDDKEESQVSQSTTSTDA